MWIFSLVVVVFLWRIRILKVMLVMEVKDWIDEEGVYFFGVRFGSVIGICLKLYGVDCVFC